MNELIEINIKKPPKLWFCPTSEDKEVKLLATQQNQSFCYLVLMWKTN